MSLRPARTPRPGAGAADTAAAIRSILDLAKLSLNTDAAKRDANDRAIPATDFYPELAEKLSRWIVNGNVRLRNTPAGWRLTYHVSFLTGTSDWLTGSSRKEPKGTEWDKLKQAMQQPPFWFKYNHDEKSWNSRSARMPDWVFRAIAERTKVVESYLINTAIPNDRISFYRGEDGTWNVSSPPPSIILKLEEVQYMLEEGYDFVRLDERNDKGHYVWAKTSNYPLPDALLTAVEERAAAVEREREQEEEQRRAQAAIDEARRVGRELQRQQERDRLIQLQRNEERRYRIMQQYVQQGADEVSEEDRQWYRDTFQEAVDEAVSNAQFKLLKDRLQPTLARLPVSSDAKKQVLRYWQMGKIIEAVLETASRLADTVVTAFEKAKLDPVLDAIRLQGYNRTDLRLPIESGAVDVFVRTTPSAARNAAAAGRLNPRAAMSWSMNFKIDSEDRAAANRGLVEGGYQEAEGRAQIQITSMNKLIAALNGIWEYSLSDEVKAGAHLWDTQPADPGPAKLGPAPERAAAEADPVPVDADGFRPKKRDLPRK